MPEIPSAHWLANPLAAPTAGDLPAPSAQADPILILEEVRRGAWDRWSLAQEAAELILWSLPDEIQNPGVLMCYWLDIGGKYYEPKDAEAAKACGATPIFGHYLTEFRKYETVWGVILDDESAARRAQVASRERTFLAELCAAEMARDKAFEESGYCAAKALEDELEAAADAIELKMTETVPTTLTGVRALADLTESRWGSSDKRDQCMHDRIEDAIEAMDDSPIKVILVAFAEYYTSEHYDNEFIAPPMVIAIDAVIAHPVPGDGVAA